MPEPIPFGDALRVWARVAALSFGGPAGQIAVMHRIVVAEKRWIGERRFLHALNYCMLLPGPEAQQLAVYLGWLLHGTRGGVVAGTLFVIPGFVSILALSFVYALLGGVAVVEGLFFGLKAAVLAIVLQAAVRIGSRVLANRAMLAVTAAAFTAIFVFDVPFPLIILTAAAIGYIAGSARMRAVPVGSGHDDPHGTGLSDAESALGAGVPPHARPSLAWSATVSGVLLVLWLGPVAALYLLLGQDHVFTTIAVFFSQMAVVTFGGAYAVLAYVAQEAVQHYAWLAPGEMLDGLGMAETTPGPLIQVVQFVGFMGAFRDPGSLPPTVAASLAAILTTWVTFVPCFLWIFLGAPFVESIRGHRALAAALAVITAAVVGVILNLAVWFALHVLFGDVRSVEMLGMRLDVPVWGTVDVPSLLLTAAAVLAVFRFRIGVPMVLAASAAVGVAYYLVAR
jgi:chromate transporter